MSKDNDSKNDRPKNLPDLNFGEKREIFEPNKKQSEEIPSDQEKAQEYLSKLKADLKMGKEYVEQSTQTNSQDMEQFGGLTATFIETAEQYERAVSESSDNRKLDSSSLAIVDGTLKENEKAEEIIKRRIDKLLDTNLKSIATKIWSFLKEVGQSIKKGFKAAAEFIKKGWEQLITTSPRDIGKGFSKLASKAKDKAQSVNKAGKGVYETHIKPVQERIDNSKVAKKAHDIGKGIQDSVNSKFNKGRESIPNVHSPSKGSGLSF